MSATEWAFERIREALQKVAKDEDGILNIVQQIWLRAHISCGVSSRQQEDKEALLCRVCAQIATVFPWWTTRAGFQLQRNTAVGGARSVEKNMNGERPTGYWWYKQVPVRQKVFKGHAVPQGLCENLIKLLANQQKDGDSPIQSIVAGVRERSREGIMEGQRNFIKVDNHCALEVGHLKEGTRSLMYEGQSSKRGASR